MTAFFRWWSIIIIYSTVLYAAHHFFDAFNYVFERDATYLSSLIFVIFIICTLRIGVISWRLHNDLHFYSHETQKLWYTSEACMGIGMVGTLVGFLLVLSTAFADIDVENTDAMKETISILAKGMGTALITSLVGLVTSMALKYQIVMIETENESL